MEINVLTIIGIGLAAMFFGYFFGLFEGRRHANKKHKKEEAAEHQALDPTPVVPVPAPEPRLRQALMELSQTDAGKPQLRIDGQEVDALRVSAEQRRRLIDLMVMLKPWVDPGNAAAAPAAAVVAKPARFEQAPTVSTRGATSAAAAGAASLVPTPPAAAVSQMSLVAQIDSILQARLAGTPLADRGIRLAEALHGGAIVFVGSATYDGVDKVTDPEIQSAIRAAIAEWENKYTPG
jgi:hypothetical protein